MTRATAVFVCAISLGLGEGLAFAETCSQIGPANYRQHRFDSQSECEAELSTCQAFGGDGDAGFWVGTAFHYWCPPCDLSDHGYVCRESGSEGCWYVSCVDCDLATGTCMECADTITSDFCGLCECSCSSIYGCTDAGGDECRLCGNGEYQGDPYYQLCPFPCSL